MTALCYYRTLREAGVPERTFQQLLRGQFAWRALSSNVLREQAQISDADIDAEIARINSLRGRRDGASEGSGLSPVRHIPDNENLRERRQETALRACRLWTRSGRFRLCAL